MTTIQETLFNQSFEIEDLTTAEARTAAFATLHHLIEAEIADSSLVEEDCSISTTLMICTRFDQDATAKLLISKINFAALEPRDHYEMLTVVANMTTETFVDGKSPSVEIVRCLLESGCIVTATNSGKDAIQYASQQLSTLSSTSTQKAANTTEIVKLIIGTKKALQLEGDLADFTIFMLNAELIKTGDLEHKTVFRDEGKMIAALLAYDTDAEKLASICAKINAEYATEITLEKIEAARPPAIEDDKDLNQEFKKPVKEKPTIGPSFWQRLMNGPTVSPAASPTTTNIKTTITGTGTERIN